MAGGTNTDVLNLVATIIYSGIWYDEYDLDPIEPVDAAEENMGVDEPEEIYY